MKHTISYLATRASHAFAAGASRAALVSRAAFAAGASRAFAAGALLTLAAGLTGCADEPATANPDGARQELRLTGVIDGAATPKAASRAITFDDLQEKYIYSGRALYTWVWDATTKAPLYDGYYIKAYGTTGKFRVYESLEDGYRPAQMYFPQSGNDVQISSMGGFFGTSITKEDITQNGINSYNIIHETYDQLNMPNGDIPFSILTRQGYENLLVAAGQTPDGSGQQDEFPYAYSDLLYARQRAARTNDDVELKFYHMLSKIELQVTFGDGVKEYDLLGVTLDDALCRGTFSPSKITDITSRTDRAAAIAATPGSEATIDLWQDTADTKRYRFIVVPQEVAGKTLTFKMLNADDLVYTFPAAAEFESGLRHVYKVTLQRTGVTAEASIHPWNSTATADGDASLTLPAAIGDYLLSDGSWVTPSEATAEQLNTVIGVVFQTDPARIGQAEKDALKALGVTAPHGLAVATKAAGDDKEFQWFCHARTSEYDRDETVIGIPNIEIASDAAATFAAIDADIDGYAHNVAIRTQRTEEYNNMNYDYVNGYDTYQDYNKYGYPAFKVAETLATVVPPPLQIDGVVSALGRPMARHCARTVQNIAHKRGHRWIQFI